MRKYIILSLFMILSKIELWAQCPMCRSAVESSMQSGKKSVGMGLNTGILMLLAMVYLVIFTAGILWYRKHKQSKSI